MQNLLTEENISHRMKVRTSSVSTICVKMFCETPRWQMSPWLIPVLPGNHLPRDGGWWRAENTAVHDDVPPQCYSVLLVVPCQYPRSHIYEQGEAGEITAAQMSSHCPWEFFSQEIGAEEQMTENTDIIQTQAQASQPLVTLQVI